MNTELHEAAARVSAWADCYEVNRGPWGDRLAVSYPDAPLNLSDIQALLAALSSPPADDVREARLNALRVAVFPWSPEESTEACNLIRELLDEVRLRGTVSPAIAAAVTGLPQHALRVGFEKAAAAKAEEEVSWLEQIAEKVEASRGTVTEPTDADEMPDWFTSKLGDLVIDSEGDGFRHIRYITLRESLGAMILADIANEAWALAMEARS